MSRDCKIIEDLIPSYIDELTNETTNEFIEDHIKDCEDCKNKIEKLKNTNEKIDDSNIKVDFLKKQKLLYRILHFVLLFIFIILVLNSNIFNTVLKINNLLNNQNNININNYYVEIKTYTPEKDIDEYIYLKDGKQISKIIEKNNISGKTEIKYNNISDYNLEKYTISNIQEYFERLFNNEFIKINNSSEEYYMIRENDEVRYYDAKNGLVSSRYFVKENKKITYKYSFGFVTDYDIEKMEKEIKDHE